MRHAQWPAALAVLVMLAASSSAQPTPPLSQPDNCTRADIVTAISDNANWTDTVQLISLLNATYLLPDSTGPGTLLLPTNRAFTALHVTPQRLVDVHGGRMVSVLAYHSLLNTGTTYSLQQLLAASPIQTDLGVLASAGNGTNITLPVFALKDSGTNVARGLYTPDVGAFGDVVRVCGLALHPIDVLLRPAPFRNTPNALDYFNGTVPANIDTLTSPGGLAAAVQNGTIQVANVPYNGTSFNGTVTGGNGAAGGAAAGAGAAAAAAGAGRILSSGTNNTLSSSAPVLLAGTVTPEGGGNATDPALGPGLIYLNGTVKGNRGVNGTATLVSSLSRNGGAQLSNATTPLAGAMINGTGFDASNLTATPAAAGASRTRQFNGTDGNLSTAAATGSFGSALDLNPDGTFNATAGQPVLLDGSVTNGTALNKTAATGSAARGNLGPGLSLVNGTVNSGSGESGTAYPVVAVTPRGVIVNSNNSVNITGASLSGTALNGTGIPARLQAGNGTGSGATAAGAGAAAAAAVAGAALALNGTGNSLSSSGPVLLAGTVTPVSGSTANESAPALGPGLIYLNGTVQDGRGVNGTATLVRSLTAKGAQLTNATTPLEGAIVNGTAVDAGNVTTIPAVAGANDTRQQNNTGGTNGTNILSTVAAGTAFGTALNNTGGGLNTTAGSPVLLDGSVSNGTALNKTAATGSAARGNLGPGPILVNGTTDSGTGVSGTAYPVVAITPTALVVNKNNGVNITDATLSGRAFNASGVPVQLQAAAAGAAAGAGAAAAGAGGSASAPAGAPGSSGAGAAGGASGNAPAPESASSSASAPDSQAIDNLGGGSTVTNSTQSATGLVASTALPLASAAAAALLLLAAP